MTKLNNPPSFSRSRQPVGERQRREAHRFHDVGETAQFREQLAQEFPDVAERVRIEMPDEKSKRHGQAVVAASLPPDDLIKR